jgi:hypothetical protein
MSSFYDTKLCNRIIIFLFVLMVCLLILSISLLVRNEGVYLVRTKIIDDIKTHGESFRYIETCYLNSNYTYDSMLYNTKPLLEYDKEMRKRVFITSETADN